MEPELTPLQKQYITFAENFLIKQNITEEVYNAYMNRYKEKINNVDTTNQQRKQITEIYNDLESLFDEKSTQGLTQAEHDIEQIDEEIRYEEEQKEKKAKSRRSKEKITG